MRTTCLIDNFNHGRFVCAAVESALNQSIPFDEIIVVDDASTDNSRQILSQRFENTAQVRLIYRPQNEGQLACLQTGILEARGDICCLLDADDVYQPGYLKTICSLYDQHPEVDSVFTSSPQLRKLIERPLIRGKSQKTGISLGLTWLGNAWIGAPTSCLSFRRETLLKLFPYPHVSDWEVRADDYLNFSSSLLGAIKFYCSEDLVTFRWHDQNNSFKCADPVSTYRRRIGMNRLKEWFRLQSQLCPDDFVNDLHREFETWQHPSFKLFSWYLRAVRQHRRSLWRSVTQSASMLSHYLGSKRILTKTHPVNERLAYVPHVISVDPSFCAANDTKFNNVHK